MSELAIRCENTGKKFCKSLKKSMFYGGCDVLRSTLGHIPDTSILRPEEFWAVEKVDFEIERGMSFGIIGPNGSGKTTLLKMLNGIFMPDKGRITVNGRVGSLIQVGAGFHPMLSGRENIYINGAILGMSNKEIDQKFDSIVEFADIGHFLDSPVKYYSSGMYVRLGFAIAVHGNPEVLLIDEILAVGDKSFQIKCYQKMHEIRKSGTTIILVSHNEYVVREHTSCSLYLDYGQKRFIGPSEQAINLYIKDVYERRLQRKNDKAAFCSNQQKKAEIRGLKFLNSQAQEVDFIETGSFLSFRVELHVQTSIDKPIVGVNFYDDHGLVYAANSYYEQANMPGFAQGQKVIQINVPELHLPTGDYLCSVVLAEDEVGHLIDWHDMTYKLVVGRAPNARGLLKLKTEWQV
ncbi:MAG: ABC transporter ATP-binding protein [Candidatus Omnitrophica bacterium]|nr:ABC transporter ATP-binding protein [Candidatus Omnitrophota bacterium]